jgi:hypothetical protein
LTLGFFQKTKVLATSAKDQPQRHACPALSWLVLLNTDQIAAKPFLTDAVDLIEISKLGNYLGIIWVDNM